MALLQYFPELAPSRTRRPHRQPLGQKAHPGHAPGGFPLFRFESGPLQSRIVGSLRQLRTAIPVGALRRALEAAGRCPQGSSGQLPRLEPIGARSQGPFDPMQFLPVPQSVVAVTGPQEPVLVAP